MKNLTKHLGIAMLYIGAASAAWGIFLKYDELVKRPELEYTKVQHEYDLVVRDKAPVQQQIWAIESRAPDMPLTEKERLEHFKAQQLLTDLEEQQKRLSHKLGTYE